MKRRRFMQYAGLGGLGLALVPGKDSLVSAFSDLKTPNPLNLETFHVDVATLNRFGNIANRQTYQASFFSERLGPESFKMVAIASGRFVMGASRTESHAKGHELPRHQVKLPAFYLSKTPVTQSQWAAIARLPKVRRDLNPNPSHFQGGDRPVESVSWLDAVEFCDRLSRKTGRHYQLPSEAQWEYACRAGTQTPFSTGETITSDWADYVGSYTYQSESAGTYHQSTLPVGHFSANAFGLQDMHGNVWEWCADSWHRNYQGAPRNGKAWVSAQHSPMRTIRGGGWLDSPAQIRSASRSGYAETALNRTIGFRIMTI